MPMPAALDGVRVLDLTHTIAGPYCTKLLADHGAEVIKVERPWGGDPSRTHGPFPGDLPHPEKSALFLHLNTNKRSLALNLKTAEGLSIARRLAASVHIVVESFKPGTVDRLGLGYDALKADNPAVVLTSISNFGQTGPYRDYRLSEIVAYAMGGPMNATGHESREPLKLGGNVVQYHAGSTAAFATMAALYRAEDEGLGDAIDVAIYETAMGSRDRRTVWLTGYAYNGQTSRRAPTSTRLGTGVRPTADGYFEVAAYGARLPALLRLIGRDDLLDDPRTRDPKGQLDPNFVDDIESSYLAYTMTKSKTEALAEAQALHMVGGAVNTIADLFSDPHFVHRAPWDTIDHPFTGPVQYPGRPFIMGESPRPQPRRAPMLGEHNEEILCGELGYAKDDLPRLRAQGVI